MTQDSELAEVQDLFDAVREACSAGVWSRGVEFARSGKVHGEREDAGEVFFRVATRGGLISPGVALRAAECDWECDCPSRADACEHVAASVIALRRARQRGEALPQASDPSGRVRYAFSRSGGGLSFEREIVRGAQTSEGESVVLLETTLAAIASGRVDGPPFVATATDIAVESALGSRRRGPMPREAMNRLLNALGDESDIRLDGQPIKVSSEPVVPHGRLDDAPGGFVLSVAPDPSISETFANGIVRCDDTLRKVGETRLSGRELEDLPRGRFYRFEQAAELATEVLPSLAERIPLEVRTQRLPRATTKEPPRILISVERDGDSLSVLPTLVYGAPPCARIDAGRLVHLSGEVPVRDEAAERLRVRQLQNELRLAPGHRVVLAAEDAVAMAARLAEWSGEVTGDAHESFYQTAPLSARLRIEGTHLELDFESSGQNPGTADSPGPGAGAQPNAPTGPRRASAEAALGAWRAGHSLVPLDGGGFAALPEDWLQRFGHRIADLLAARDDAGAVPTHALPDLGRLCDDLDEPRPVALEGLAPLLDGFDGIPHSAPPTDLTATLRHYQEEGVDWLLFMRRARLGALLADDMGLGKTVQALCALSGRSLVVAPTSVLHNWADEIDTHRPGLRHSLYHGPRRKLDPDVDVTLTSYAVLRLDSAILGDVEWDCVVLDEAQSIKNPDSQVSRAAYGLRSQFRVALTGTPVENRLEDLWSQFHFLNRGLLGARRDFQDRVARAIADGDAGATERLRERLKPFVLRRLKKDVAPELPPRTEVVLHVALSDAERDVYDAVRAASQQQVVLRLQEGGNMLAALEALLRLRQAACHAGLVPGQTAESSSKVELLVDRLEQAVADGHKALVFSQWTSLLDRVEPSLRSADIDWVRLDGSTRDRGGVVARFQSASGPPVMLISLRAGGTGLNLTAADHVFLLDPWWNPAVEDQAADRTHRIGQDRPVVVHRLVAAGTVEERILELQASKRALSEAALGESAQAAGLTRDDLLDLFR